MTKLLSMRSREAPQVILATASSGFGHSQAARNLDSVLGAIDPKMKVAVVNIYDFMSPTYRRIVERGWEYVSLTPGLRHVYRILHRLVISNTVLSRGLHRGFRGIARRMAAHINVTELRHFIALHPAAVSIGAQLKSETGCQLSVIATDFVLHSVHYHALVDRYLVAPQCTFVGAVWRSVKHRGDVYRVGIPLADNFRSLNKHRRSGDEVKESFQILVSFGACGYRGLTNLPLLIKLIKRTDPSVRFIVLAGHDTQFLAAANRAIKSIDACERVTVFRFVDEISELMAKSHLVIGKAGGLTISEAFAAGLPIVVIDTLPGQEEYNAQVIECYGAGIWTRDLTRILRFIQELQEVDRWIVLRHRILDLGRPASSHTIATMLVPQKSDVILTGPDQQTNTQKAAAN